MATFNNIPRDSKPHQSTFPISDVWFIETTDTGDIKLVTREDEDVHLFRCSCCVFFIPNNTITIQ